MKKRNLHILSGVTAFCWALITFCPSVSAQQQYVPATDQSSTGNAPSTLTLQSDRDAICAGGWSADHGYQYLSKDPDGTTHGYMDRAKPDPHITAVTATVKDKAGNPLVGKTVVFSWDMPGDAPAETQTVTTGTDGKASVDVTSGDEVSKDTDDDTNKVLFDRPVLVRARCSVTSAVKKLEVLAPDVKWQFKNEAGNYVEWDGETWALYSQERDDVPLRVLLQFDNTPVSGHSISWGFDKIFDKAGEEVLTSDPEYSTYGHMSGGTSTTTNDGGATATFTLGYNVGGIDFCIDDESVNTLIPAPAPIAARIPIATIKSVSFNSSRRSLRLANNPFNFMKKKKRAVKKSPRKGVYKYVFDTPAWKSDWTPRDSTPWSYPAPSGVENNELLDETHNTLIHALRNFGQCSMTGHRSQATGFQSGKWWISQAIGDDHESYGTHYADTQWNGHLYGAAFDIVLTSVPIGKHYSPLGPRPEFKTYVHNLRGQGFVAWHRWAGESPSTSENEIHCIDPAVPFIKKELANAQYRRKRDNKLVGGQIYQFLNYQWGGTGYIKDFTIKVEEHDAVQDRSLLKDFWRSSKYGLATKAPAPSF